MASGNTSEVLGLPSDPNPVLLTALTATSAVALLGCLLAVVTKLTFRFVIPVAWKCCLLCQDIACLALSLGLLLISRYVDGAGDGTCKAGGFFTAFGVLDLVSSITITGLTFIVIQNPSKMSQLSTFRSGIFLAIVIPQKILSVILAALPVMPIDYFDTTSPYPLACFPVRQEGEKGATFGAILFFIMWSVLIIGLILCIVVAVRFWAGPGTRVHASSPSLWQMQKVEQGRSLHKFTLAELALAIIVMFVVTIVVYTNTSVKSQPQWIGLLSLVVPLLVHVVLATIQFFMWSGICCDKTGHKKEPHHRLKQLELIRIEGPGKLRLKASWTAGKGVWRRGLLKVYGPAHIKAWAQEIVVLGLLRKSHSASVLQCLWTSNTNPYYETMTLISGDIVTSDSRLTCLELTSSGTLQDLLKTMEVPLPEPCQRTIMHDIAEGLSYLHDQNVLHRNLTSAAVYLKGSVQCLVLRAAIGDFEDAQIYGTLLTGSPNSTVSRKRFFYPDIRAYALVGIELLGKICECRQRERQPHRRTAVKVSQSLKDSKGRSKHSNQHEHRSAKSIDNGKDLAEINDTSGDKNQRKAKKYNNMEVPYCAPGEAEYVLTSNKEKSPIKHVHDNSHEHDSNDGRLPAHNSKSSHSPAKSHTSNSMVDTQLAEYNIDENWKLQMRATDLQQGSDWRGKDWKDNAEPGSKLNGPDSTWDEYKAYDDRYHHSQVPGITHVKEAGTFEFPDNSVFRATEGEGEDLDMIEEEIERGQHMKLLAKSGNYKHGGYITSVTDDGREIFIPATYALKKSSGNSSSGYGSCSGSTTVHSDHYSTGGTVNSGSRPASASDRKYVHKTTSTATISSFEDDILEVLPGIADVNEGPRRGEYMLKELLKAKHDARVEQLIVSYEDRVRKGELGNQDGWPVGVVFPKKRGKQGPDPTELEKSPEDAGAGHEQNNDVTDNKKQTNKLSSPRPKTAASSMTQRLQRGPHRPASASSSFSTWNARSSMKRNKARLALQKALGGKASQTLRHPPRQTETRGNRGKEVEMKYASRPGTAVTLVQEYPSSSDIPDGDASSDAPHVSDAADPHTITPVDQRTPDSQSHPKATSRSVHVKKPDPHSSPVVRTPSTKTRPAPEPPAVSPIKHIEQNTPTSGTFPYFSSHETDLQSSLRPADESFTSVEPASTESESTNQSSIQSREQTTVEKIESDMNSIIQSNSVVGHTSIAIPPGIRLIDSGFDSASVSSEESCLCAAAALQAAEDGSCSCPSELYSQGTCSCACSNCLGSAQGYNNNSSCGGSQDSESWSNSNSFSSYDANMYRRKLPSKQDSPGGVLAPDEQYPAPGHRVKNRPVNSLRPYNAYSPKRNRRRLSHARGNYPSSASETSSAASRRYRELIKRGVPLRVSVISGDGDNADESVVKDTEQFSEDALVNTDNVTDSQELTNNLFRDLESQGFFVDDPENRQFRSMRSNGKDIIDEDDGRYQDLSPIPSLEEIIKEIPDETGNFSDETKAFLNRPESELSVKALQAVLSRHGSATDGKSTEPTELIIDRIFSHHGPQDTLASSFGLQGSLDLDESAIREVALLPSNAVDESVTSDAVGLLSGMDGRHVKYCHNISLRVHMVNMNELLPANPQSFEKLKSRLQLAGSVGSIGTQILELIRMCWLNETPPTTAAIVDQLTDHVTETEL